MSKQTAPTVPGTISTKMSSQKNGSDLSPDERSGESTRGNIRKRSEGDAVSLCSSHLDNDNHDALDDEPLPLPGRESHTCDIGHFQMCLERVRTNTNRRDKVDHPFHPGFWRFMHDALSVAQPVGYSEVSDSREVIAKGPADNEAFMEKIVHLDLINPIHPNRLAEACGIPLEKVLTELLFATKAGMMSMKLTPNCQRCGSAVCAVERFQDLPSEAYCEGCRYHNSMECLSKIKVVFLLNRDCFYVLAENFACQPSQASMAANQIFAVVPATFSGSGYRYSLGCGGEKKMRDALPSGRYRMHCPVARTDNYLVVNRDSTDNDEPIQLELHVSDLVCRSPLDKRKTLEVEHGKMHIDVFTDTRSFYILWIQDDLDDDVLLYLPENERKPYTNARQLLSHATYQYLYADATEESLTGVLRRMNKVAAQPASSPPRKKRSRVQMA